MDFYPAKCERSKPMYVLSETRVPEAIISCLEPVTNHTILLISLAVIYNEHGANIPFSEVLDSLVEIMVTVCAFGTT
jgi:hypothetical protein